MKCRLRVLALVYIAFFLFENSERCAFGGFCYAVGTVSAQDARPFDEIGEDQFRAQFDNIRRQPSFLPAGQRPGDRGDEGLFDGQERPVRAQNPIDTLNNETLLSNDSLATDTESFQRFEPRSGDPVERNLVNDTERGTAIRRRMNGEQDNAEREGRPVATESEAGVDFETPDDRRTALRGNNERNSFEDDFLAAERAADQLDEGDNDENEDETQLSDLDEETDLPGARERRQQRRRGERLGGRGQQGLRGGQRLQRQRDGEQVRAQLAADEDVNDITGSIRPNAIEDPYTPIGKRIGTFLLFPELTVTALYSDNPTASLNNGPGDYAIEIQPRFLLRSDWRRHSLEFEGQMTNSFYDELSSEDVEEWFLRSTGRIDLRRNEYIEVEGRIENAQDDRGDVDAANTDAELATFETLALTALYHVELNRTTLEFRGNLTNYDYEDVTNGLGQVINNDDLDYLETNASVTVGYTFHPGFYVFTEGAYVNRDYDSQLDDLGFARSNEGWAIRQGMILDLTAKLRLSGSLGYQWLRAEEDRFADLEEFIWSASLLYRPSEKTSITLRAEREIDGTDIDGAIGLLETEYSFSIDHYFRPHILLQSRLDYQIEDYQTLGFDQTTLSTTMTLQYILNRKARLVTSYQYSDVENSDGGDYQENIVRFGVNLTP